MPGHTKATKAVVSPLDAKGQPKSYKRVEYTSTLLTSLKGPHRIRLYGEGETYLVTFTVKK